MEINATIEPSRFYDGGMPDSNGDPVPGQEPDPHARMAVLLARRFEGNREDFQLRRRIAYSDRTFGEILVPHKLDTFWTDLTSVPGLFTWLVPKSGRHLPAALIHDGLIPDGDGAKGYVAAQDIDRIDADHVFRNAMLDTDVSLIRRWLIWAAVANASLWKGARPGTRWTWLTRWYRLVQLLVVLGIVYLGTSATLEVLDVNPVTWLPWMGDLPWIGGGPWWERTLQGLSGAVVIPLVTGLLWGYYYRAGAILGVALATLLHVTVAVGAVAGLYWVAERFTGSVILRFVMGGAALGAAIVVFVVALVT
jgi:Protein of unknown function (DUF1353)